MTGNTEESRGILALLLRLSMLQAARGVIVSLSDLVISLSIRTPLTSPSGLQSRTISSAGGPALLIAQPWVTRIVMLFWPNGSLQ